MKQGTDKDVTICNVCNAVNFNLYLHISLYKYLGGQKGG